MSAEPKTGLYREAYEKDSCGFGLIASLDDQPSHWLVKTAIASLNRLTHRGAIATDGKTGDGCGLMLKKPEKFLRAAREGSGHPIWQRSVRRGPRVPATPMPALADRARAELAKQLGPKELKLAGWRKLPTDPAACGDEALKTLPRIEQVFVNAPADTRRGRVQPQAVPGAPPCRDACSSTTTRCSTCRACRRTRSSTRAW